MESYPQIVVTRPLPFSAMERIPPEWNVQIAGRKDHFDREKLFSIIPRCDGLICLLTDTIDKDLIDAGEKLKIIANIGVGYNNIDWKYAASRGIEVTNTPGVLTDATADLAMALLLSVSRRVLEADRFLRDGHFKGWDLELMLGLELNGATLGIVRVGRIGQAFALRARAFGMKIIYYNRKPLSSDIEEKLNAKWVTFDELLRKSDILSLHCPLTEETHHLIGKEEFRRMKKGVIIINTARGAVVDEAELVKALKEGYVGGVGLDVYENEPQVHLEKIYGVTTFELG